MVRTLDRKDADMKKEKKMTMLNGIDYRKEKLQAEYVDTIFDHCDFSESAFLLILCAHHRHVVAPTTPPTIQAYPEYSIDSSLFGPYLSSYIVGNLRIGEFYDAAYDGRAVLLHNYVLRKRTCRAQEKQKY